jgi:hypothetical protein
LPASGSTPYKRVCGDNARVDKAEPEQAATAEADEQAVERAHFFEQLLGRRALPAITSAWSYGGISVMPLLGQVAADFFAVFLVAVIQHHFRAVARVAATLAAGASSGMTMVAGMPIRRADSAIACA